MATRVGGNRRKTRNIFSKHYKNKGKISLTNYLKEYVVGDRVVLKAEPAVQKGLYFRRFHGKSGIVKGKKGNCYEVAIKDGKAEKSVIVHPVHLKNMVKK